ncbi:hypothetical protein E4U43_005557 [Claviceps pusilla]|uniref:Uncharacterized protein n=1 Tax=Claviceps pusilla TaxID=123648 RepID=A0A9P7ST98_9HYPO|nr:hypothetical protein E4U43_005557 [Claviceps pusilla]
MFSASECPPESETWLGIIKNTVHVGEEHRLCVAVYITKCAHILAIISPILQQHDLAAAEAQYECLVQQLGEAEEQVDQYVETTGPIDYSQDLTLYMHNMYLSASIKSHSYILYLANLLMHSGRSQRPSQAELRAQRAHCVRRVRAAAQQIVDNSLAALSTLKAARDRPPWVLFDALKMVWPLTSVYVSGVALAAQRTQAHAGLLFIGHEVGVRQALHAVAENRTLSLEARLPLRVEYGDGDDDTTRAYVE